MDVPAFFGYDAVVDPTTQRVPRRAGTSPVWNVPVNTKPGVDVDLHPVMSRALEVASVRGDVITSGREGHPGDGVHKPNSLHYDGQAMDVRPTKDLDAQVKRYANLGYNVIVKKRPYHLHVSRDPEGQRV